MVRKSFKFLLAFILIINIVSMNCISFGEDKKNDREKIENAIEGLRDYYEDDGEYSFREAIGLNYTSEDLDSELKKIAKKLIIDDGETAADYAGNIIGIIAGGKDPKNYEGEDYVKILVASQEKSGRFIVKSGDKHPATLAWSIMALDMAKAEYETKEAVEALLEDQNEEGGFTLTPDVDTAAMAITALANHRDIEGVEDAVDKALEFIKSQQLDSGGFPFMGSDNPYSTSCVIQGLIANGINPLSEEWEKNGNSLLDALLSFKSGKYFEYKTKYGSEISSATEQALIALADLYKNESMYQNVKIHEGNIEEPSDELILEWVGSENFRTGEEASIKVKIENNAKKDQEITLIVALYDTEDDKMVNYTYVTKVIEKNDKEILEAGFLIPEKGEYEVKGFLWDNLEDMNILADPIYIEVR